MNSDIIYVGGGDTLSMINLWKSTGFDKVLKEAWQNNKLLCGISAGGGCWFKECISDSLKMLYGEDQPLTPVRCLDFYNFVFAPHGHHQDRYDALKKLNEEYPNNEELMSAMYFIKKGFEGENEIAYQLKKGDYKTTF